MSKEEKKQITPLITMDEESSSKTLVHQELSDIDDIYLDLKYKSLFFYNILSKYNIYIIKYISNYLDNLYKDTIRDHIVSYLDHHLLLDNNSSLISFRKDEIVREGKPLVKDTLKVSLEPKVILEGLHEKYPTLDLETEFEKWKDYQLAHGKRYKNNKAAFRNWCRNAVEYQAKNGTITPNKVNTYKEMFDE
tara:strand:+ start:1245 stop:1820 length:576 start_codon:yes stop_codon:yes gene_type:complete